MINPTVIIFLCLFVIQDFTCGFQLSRYTRSVNTSQLTPQSPCPTVFRYKNDQSGDLIGVIKANKTDREGEVQLDVELSVEISFEEFNGNITLTDEKHKVINEIMNGEPILYRVLFPAWRKLPPIVTNILVNGKQICSGPRIPAEMELVMTTTHLQHKLSLGVIPPEDILLPPPRPSEIRYQDSFNIKTTDIPAIKPDSSSNPYNVNSSPPNYSPPDLPPPPVHAPTPVASLDIPKLRPSGVIGGQNVDDFPISVQTTNRPSKIGSFNRICGRPIPTNLLIVNGGGVPRGAYPWLVAMFKQSDGLSLHYICVGSLISDRHVVTAAHCVKLENSNIKANEIVCVFGKLNIRKWITEPEERMFEPDSIIVHPDFEFGKANANIAIMVFQESIPFNQVIKPVCLWQGSVDLTHVVGHIGTVVGWGRDENGDLSLAEPKQVNMPIIDQFECLTGSSPSVQQAFVEIISKNTFCAGFRNGSGPCSGDSGAAFLLKRDGVYYLRGVVSTALQDSTHKTCNLQEYVVFTDAAKHLGWISDILKQK